jgi:hypothetical protein
VGIAIARRDWTRPAATCCWQCRFRCRRGARREAQNRRREPVAAARYVLDDGLLAVTDGLTNLAHAVCQRLVGHDHIRPDRLHQLLLGYNTVSVFKQITQDLERLWAQLKLAVRRSQRAVCDIQRISLELEHLRRRAVTVFRTDWQ